jgi:hypothetical protein
MRTERDKTVSAVRAVAWVFAAYLAILVIVLAI